MAKYLGGCHCGAVRFEVEADLQNVMECNCSICTRKGSIHHRVKSFTLISGDDHLSLYQFGQKIARHLFCKTCGIHAFTNSRAAPGKMTVNLRCLDDFPSFRDKLVIKPFDGRNWDAAAATFKFEG